MYACITAAALSSAWHPSVIAHFIHPSPAGATTPPNLWIWIVMENHVSVLSTTCSENGTVADGASRLTSGTDSEQFDLRLRNLDAAAAVHWRNLGTDRLRFLLTLRLGFFYTSVLFGLFSFSKSMWSTSFHVSHLCFSLSGIIPVYFGQFVK